MNNEWRDLPTLADVAAAQAAGDEIQCFAGVVSHKTGKFQSQIKANGKYKYLGLFATSEEANATYQRAKSELHGA